MLWETYGGTEVNGYKLLDPHIGIIFADHIDAPMIDKICSKLVVHNFAINNVIFGSGGALLQKMNRDTINAAIKLSEVTVNGQIIPQCKTTPGKESKSGTFDLPMIYENGNLLVDESFTEIRQRIGIQW
jgi:nicotinamide phosphoribosyltransferase